MPSEAAIEEEMLATGYHRMACIRRIQQRRALQREVSERNLARRFAPVSQAPDGEPLFFVPVGDAS